MGNSFVIGWGDFHGYAVETYLSCWGALAVGQSHAPGRTIGDALVSLLRHQPQDGLQVVEAFHRNGSARIVRSIAPPAPRAVADAPQVDSTHRTGAQTASVLGGQKNSSALAAPLWSSPGHRHHCAVAQTVAIGQSTAPPIAQGVLAAPSAVAPSPRAQPHLDGGFQRLVSHWQWPTCRTFDGARFVQSLRPDHPPAARPAVASGPSGVPTTVPPVWPAASHSHRQWQPVRFDRPGRVVAFECRLAGFGDRGGVDAAWAYRRQRRPRANAPSVQSGDDAPGGGHAPRPATSHYWLGQLLQPDSTASGTGPRTASAMVWPESPATDQPHGAVALSKHLAPATGAQQRPNQVAWAQAFYRRSLRASSPWSQPPQVQCPRGLFWPASDRAFARYRRRRHASGTLPPQDQPAAKTQSVTYVLSSICYPCPDTVPWRTKTLTTKQRLA